jgi:RNA polymerase sigma-70 factor (ECF subfamily)
VFSKLYVNWIKAMERSLDVNPAFTEWRLSTGQPKELALIALVRKLEIFAERICWQRLPDFKDDFPALINGIVWRTIKQADKFKGKSRFSTWFYRIIINECNRFLRNKKELFETELEEFPTKNEQVDIRIDLISLLNTLEGQDHTLFRLVAEGEDWDTIGATLGLNRNAALVRWNRLKRKIRDAAV